MATSSRRELLKQSMGAGAAALAAGPLGKALAAEAAEAAGAATPATPAKKPGSKMKLGLVTYMWGARWDLPTLIKTLEAGKVLGVELRTTHKHGVERTLTAEQRKAVKKRFDDSPVTLVGLGSNERFDHPKPAALTRAIEATKAFVKLSADVGGSGVKVKPNSFQRGVEREKTIEQIGKSLNVVGKFAADYNQQIRLEVHGSCGELPTMKKIMDVATHPNVGVCWNSNAADLKGKGLEHNFNLVKGRFGATAHTRTLDHGGYPWQQLISLYVRMDYDGWILLECTNRVKDYAKELARQQQLFQRMVAKAQAAL